MRNITVYSTAGKTTGVINSEATTYGALKLELMENGFQVDGMKAVVGETRVTLEVDGAILPETDFKLFLMPFKTKSGADMSRGEIMSTIQEFMAEDGEKAKAHFNAGENFTRKKSTHLIELINSYDNAEQKVEQVTKDVVNSDLITVSKSELNEVLNTLLDIDTENFDIYGEELLDIALDKLKSLVDNDSESSSNDSENDSENALAKEAREIAREFNN